VGSVVAPSRVSSSAPWPASRRSLRPYSSFFLAAQVRLEAQASSLFPLPLCLPVMWPSPSGEVFNFRISGLISVLMLRSLPPTSPSLSPRFTPLIANPHSSGYLRLSLNYFFVLFPLRASRTFSAFLRFSLDLRRLAPILFFTPLLRALFLILNSSHGFSTAPESWPKMRNRSRFVVVVKESVSLVVIQRSKKKKKITWIFSKENNRNVFPAAERHRSSQRVTT
jgi:hypothetical protein